MILVIVGSTRPVRIGAQLAEHLVPLVAAAASDHRVEVVDLRELALPFLDEPRQPSDGDYVQAHTRAWSATVTSSDAVVLIAPQYNGGYPPAVKNAIDFLYAEWRDKPFLVISYGSRGGPQCQRQLTEVLHYIHADPVEGGVQIPIPGSDYSAAAQLMHPHDHVAAVAPALEVALKALLAKLPPRSSGSAATQ